MQTYLKKQAQPFVEKVYPYYEYLGDGLLFVGEAPLDGDDEVYVTLYDEYACLNRLFIQPKGRFNCTA
jgi:hypothetical protein